MPEARFTTVMQCSEKFLANIPNLDVIENKTSLSIKWFSPYTSLISTINLLRCLIWATVHKYFKLDLKALINNDKLREYANTDVIIHLAADIYSENFGIRTVIEHSKDILLGVLLKKPVVIWAESPGPFNSRLARWLARFTLNRASLITLREEVSSNLIRDLGVNKPPLYLTADPAFLLEPAPPDRINEIFHGEGINTGTKPLIGVTFTLQGLAGGLRRTGLLMALATSTYNLAKYALPERLFLKIIKMLRRVYKPQEGQHNLIHIKTLVEIINHLTQKLGATVILIPHTEEGEVGLFSEKTFYEQILSQVGDTEAVKKIAGNYTTEEIKGIIGKCDLFIGQKMHANIAALSQGIPTIALAYSHKFYGIMKMLSQEEYTYGRLDAQEVTKAIDSIWSRRNEVKSKLKSNLPPIREAALLNGELVKQLLQIV